MPGVRLCDLLPQCAGMMDKWSIVRSLHHEDAGHSTGDQICFTGYPSGPNPDENSYPSCGSIVSKQLGHLTPHMPAYVMIPRLLPGAGSAGVVAQHERPAGDRSHAVASRRPPRLRDRVDRTQLEQPVRSSPH